MKRCPQCNRTYTDDALSFCLDDGSPLASVSEQLPINTAATVQYPPPRETSQPTIAYRPGQMPPPSVAPSWTPVPPPQPQKRSVWPWLLGIGAIVVLMGVGLVVLIFVVARISTHNTNDRANVNANNSNSRVANRNSNSSNSNANSNSRTTGTFTDDFSTKSWGTGPSQYGDIFYQDDQYHMHATKDGYIVMYAPDQSDYRLESGTVRVTARSVSGTSPSAGYGLVVDGEKKEGALEDYGFLVYNGDVAQYKIVEHKSGTETKLVDWTRSSTIRKGTSSNEIEVRMHDGRLELYINGQYVTSVTDSAGFKRGLVGLYTSDTPEVAFDDLQITRSQ
jgi:hypothetical protein